MSRDYNMQRHMYKKPSEAPFWHNFLRPRVNLGMARGNDKIQSYMNIINYDLTTLLRWKNRRVKFEG